LKYTILTLKHGVYSNFTFNNIPISNSETVRYLGLNLDSRLICNTHIQIKRLTLNNRMLKPLLIINKCTILKTKLLIYKNSQTYLNQCTTALRQVKKSNTNRIPTFQNISLRWLSNAPKHSIQFNPKLWFSYENYRRSTHLLFMISYKTTKPSQPPHKLIMQYISCIVWQIIYFEHAYMCVCIYIKKTWYFKLFFFKSFYYILSSTITFYKNR